MSKIRVRNLEKYQESLIDLLIYAERHGDIAFTEDRADEARLFVNLFTKGLTEGLPLSDLELLLALTQEMVALPVYTTDQAATWLGMGIDGIRQVVWKSDPPKIKTRKPGHDVLIEHEELVRFSQN